MDDNLDPLFLPPPASPAQDMRYRQGTILTFNQVTLSNTVSVGGTTLTDLPLLGVAEAASLTPGSIVGITSILSERGTATWAIMGRFVIPGTADATNAITQVSQRIYTATVATFEDTASATFTDLATVGPAVTANIGASGRALVIVSASMAVPNKGGAMSFEVSGASTLAASITRALALSDTDATSSVGAFFSRVIEVSGLNAGSNTFTAKYERTSGATNVGFQDRNITVFAL